MQRKNKLKKPHHEHSKNTKNTKNTKKVNVRIAILHLNGAMSAKYSAERRVCPDLGFFGFLGALGGSAFVSSESSSLCPPQ